MTAWAKVIERGKWAHYGVVFLVSYLFLLLVSTLLWYVFPDCPPPPPPDCTGRGVLCEFLAPDPPECHQLFGQEIIWTDFIKGLPGLVGFVISAVIGAVIGGIHKEVARESRETLGLPPEDGA